MILSSLHAFNWNRVSKNLIKYHLIYCKPQLKLLCDRALSLIMFLRINHCAGHFLCLNYPNFFNELESCTERKIKRNSWTHILQCNFNLVDSHINYVKFNIPMPSGMKFVISMFVCFPKMCFLCGKHHHHHCRHRSPTQSNIFCFCSEAYK